ARAGAHGARPLPRGPRLVGRVPVGAERRDDPVALGLELGLAAGVVREEVRDPAELVARLLEAALLLGELGDARRLGAAVELVPVAVDVEAAERGRAGLEGAARRGRLVTAPGERVAPRRHLGGLLEQRVDLGLGGPAEHEAAAVVDGARVVLLVVVRGVLDLARARHGA